MMSPRLAFALETASAAGRRTLAHFQAAEYELKADDSPVTVADREAERFIRQAIETSYPRESILGEEEGGVTQPNQWVIDPIDGTKSFICGVPLFATLLSYEEEGVPMIGVACFPALGMTLWAERGSGAVADGRPIRVSQTTDLDGAVVCCGGHRTLDRSGKLPGFMAIAEHAMATRTWCDAYGHAMVAMGRADAMIDPVVAPWDLSAMSLIVEEAGGASTDFSNRRIPRFEAVSSNRVLHDRILECFHR